MTLVMTPTRKAAAIASLHSALIAIEAVPTVTPCDECLHFANGHCHTWKTVVPEQNQPTGCSHWEQGVPF